MVINWRRTTSTGSRIPPCNWHAFAQPASAWQRRARYGGYGEITLDGLVRLLISHDHQHLAGMQWLLMRLNADLRLAIPLA